MATLTLLDLIPGQPETTGRLSLVRCHESYMCRSTSYGVGNGLGGAGVAAGRPSGSYNQALPWERGVVAWAR